MYRDQITFRCAKCGSKKFDIPANPKPNDMIACERGHAMKFADVQKLGRRPQQKDRREDGAQ